VKLLQTNALYDGPRQYRPVLLLTVSSVTPQTFDRLTEFFAGVLDVYLLYGNPKEERDFSKRSHILPTNGLEAKYNSLDPMDPNVSFRSSFSFFSIVQIK
jgi:hypothetical protein